MKSFRRSLPLTLVAFVATIFAAGAAWAEERTVKGTVIDSATRQGLAGASVGIKGTSLTANTQPDGSFTLARAPDGDLVLVVEAEGHASREVTLPAGNDSARVMLTPQSISEEIVVTGRASGTKRQNVAVSVAKVRTEDLNEVSAATVDQVLQGKVVGANIQANDGAPGGGMQVRLRGISSINGAAEPLFVLDGMIVSNVAIPSGVSAVTKSNAGSNPSLNQDSLVNRIADFQPEDIDSIEVLKGAAAAAIYGSKASNGVIIINTKKGQPGPPRIDFTQRFGESFLSKELGMRTFTNRADAVAAFGSAAGPYFDRGVTYNHDKDLAGRHDLGTESILSISGGTTNGLNYYVSGMVKNDPGIIGNTGYQKQSVRLNLGQDLTDFWHVNVNSYLIHSVASRGISNNDNTNSSFYIVLPFIPNFYDIRRRADGTYPNNPFSSNFNNPVQTAALMTNDEGLWRFLTALDTTVKLVNTETQRLNFVANGGLDRFQQENNLLFPPTLYWQAPDQTQNLPGTALFATSNNLNYNLGFNLVHNWFPAGDYSTTSSAGFQYESRDLKIVRNVGRDLVAGQGTIGAATQVTVASQYDAAHDRGGYLQEEVLLLDRKLYLTAGLRGDSSSTNGNPNTVYFYPKAGASYRFLAPVANVDDLKVRLGYGETGNQPLYGQRFTELGLANVNGNPAVGVAGVLGSSGIHPERAREIEAGTDLLLLGGRAIVELNLYQRTITDLLLQRAFAPSTGFESQFFNGGVLRNRGIEVSVEGTPVQRGDMRWQTQVAFAKNVSQITSLPVPAYNYKDFGTVYGVHRIEQGQSATQIVGNDGAKPDGTCCLIHKLGDSEPDFTMHFSNRFAWGGLTLFFLLDWQAGSSIVNITRNLYDAGSNSPDQVPAGNNRLAQNILSARPYIESGTFVKLREVSLSYDLPRSALVSLGNVAKKVRFKVSGRNLLTFTPYSGFDPEVSNFGNDPIDRNIDLAPFPPSRSFWTSIELGFY
jgi:TonB-linked SusC/RagA family outer membrane protein